MKTTTRNHVRSIFPLALMALASLALGQSLPLDNIKLPAGFAIDIVARVPGARAMTWSDKGTLFVGSSDGGVYAITFAAPNAGGAASVHTIASRLTDPAGVAFRNGALYVSPMCSGRR